jgi:hypothetical protein
MASRIGFKEIWTQIDDLESAREVKGGTAFSAISYKDESIFFSKDASDNPAVLFCYEPSIEDKVYSKIVLERLSIEVVEGAMISFGNKTESRSLYLITLKSLDSSLFQLFFEVCVGLSKSLGSSRTQLMIQARIASLIDLFRDLDRSGTKELLGLWGELYVIKNSSSVEKAIQYWQVEGARIHDFRSPKGDRFEVKTTLKDQRIHRFSYNQLVEVDRTAVVSIKTASLDSGISVGDLIDKIADSLIRDEIRGMFFRKVVSCLGKSWKSRYEFRFSDNKPRFSLKIISAKNIPRLEGSLPSGLTNVSYDSNLELAPSVGGKEYETFCEGVF